MATLVVSTPNKRPGRSILRAAISGDAYLLPFTFVPSASYATGGDTITAADMPSGYKTLLSPFSINPCPYVFKLDVANSKLLAYGLPVAGAAEVTAATNLQTAAGSAAITIFFLVQ